MMSQELFDEKEQSQPEGRKLFPNKKANIALAVAFGIIVVAIIGVAIYANI